MTDGELIQYQRKQIQQLQELVAYYRDFAPDMGSVWVAPPGYFTHQNQGKWMAGRVVSGHLDPFPQTFDTEEQSVAATQDHYLAMLERTKGAKDL